MSKRPKIKHVYQNHHLDSARWSQYAPRADDIIIATSYKAGTTFTQTIVGNMLFPDGHLPGAITDISPWLDYRFAPLEDVLGQLDDLKHRRFLKTHLPLDSLPYFEQVKYICVTRDPRDVFMSLLNHWGHYPDSSYEQMNSVDGIADAFPRYVDDVKSNWRAWITKGTVDWEVDGYPYWSHLRHALTFWEYRHLPNIMMLHFNDLIAGLDGEMKKISDFLQIEVPAESWEGVVERCTFAAVKKDPSRVMSEQVAAGFIGGTDTFFYKGTNGRWVGVLDDDDLALYHEAMAKLPPDYAHWLANGGPVSNP